MGNSACCASRKPTDDVRTRAVHVASAGASLARPRGASAAPAVDLQAALAQLDVATIIADDSGTVSHVSAAALTLLGYTRGDELLGGDVTMIMPPSFRPLHKTGMARYLRTGVPRVIGHPAVPLRALRRDGTEVPVLLTLARVAGGFVAALTGRDKEAPAGDKLRAIEGELASTRRTLAERTRFASYLSHEVRVPLSALGLGVDELLTECTIAVDLASESDRDGERERRRSSKGVELDLTGELSPLAKEAAAGVAGAAEATVDAAKVQSTCLDMRLCCDAILHVVNDVLDLDKLQSGLYVWRRVPTLLEPLLRTCVSVCCTGLEASEADVEVEVSPAVVKHAFWVDKNRLSQVIRNFASNALTYTPRGGIVRVTATADINPVTFVKTPASPSGAADAARSRKQATAAGSGAGGADASAGAATPAAEPPSAPVAFDLSGVVRIEVFNTGPRIPEQYLDELFREFVQLPDVVSAQDATQSSPAAARGDVSTLGALLATPTSRVGGARSATGQHTGLGLAIAKHIIEDGHDGRVYVTSTDEGTTFGCTLRMPCKALRPEELRKLLSSPSGDDYEHELAMHNTSAVAGAGAAGGDAGVRAAPVSTIVNVESGGDADGEVGSGVVDVLYVEDSALNRKAVCRVLSRLGLTHATADDGQAALAWLGIADESAVPPRPCRCRLVLMDRRMPNMDGVAATRAVVAAYETLPVVGCTGDALQTDQDQMRAAGARAVVTKPVTIAQLRRAFVTCGLRVPET